MVVCHSHDRKQIHPPREILTPAGKMITSGGIISEASLPFMDSGEDSGCHRAWSPAALWTSQLFSIFIDYMPLKVITK